MLAQLLFALACEPRRSSICTRVYLPVCANGTTYSNECLAQSAGFHSNCAHFVTQGVCDEEPVAPRSETCEAGEFFSEKGMCVPKPWSDFTSCEVEKGQGACPDGNDPNPWVGEHCATTCGVHTQVSRGSD